ncbi:MAG: hypothetical protein LRY73_10155 [Bacillus sp. (in: Bacteria)]|nr:hypothetical protein [Bacillus sp. (in: firmicutes)]
MKYILIGVAVLFFMAGCSSNEDIIQKAKEELPMEIHLPSYLPDELELSRAIFEGDLLLLTYESEDTSTYIEFSQEPFNQRVNTQRLMEFVETGEDPYEEIPNFQLLEIGEFVGEYRLTPELNALAYVFVPLISRTDHQASPSYWIRSVGVEEEEFHKVIESLQ